MNHIKISFLVLALLTSLSGCSFNSNLESTVSYSKGAVYSGEKIPAEVKTEVDELVAAFIGSIAEKNSDYLKDMLYEPNAQTQKDIDAVVASYSESIKKDTEYSTMEEYYFITSSNGSSSRTMAESNDGEYTVSTQAINGEIYISFIILAGSEKETLLTIEHVREVTEWKIRQTYINNYSFYGMNLLDVYEKAKEYYANSQLLSALVYIYAFEDILRPSSLMQYNKESEIIAFANDLKKEFQDKYELPMEFDELQNVVLYGIDSKRVTGGLMLDFMYTTSLDLNDTSKENKKAIEDEAHRLHDFMSQIFPEINENFNSFLYGASMEIPANNNVQLQRYGTIIETKK